MALAHFTPSKGYATFQSQVFPGFTTPNTATVTTATTPITLTVANVLGGLLLVNCDDAGTAKWPTAVALVAGIQGCQVGSAVVLTLLNNGDTTLTVAINTGGTLATGSTATQATVTGKRWIAVITNATLGSEAYTLYSTGAASAY